MKGYCLTCKTITEIADAKEERLKNGQRVYKGKCSVCKTEIIKKKE